MQVFRSGTDWWGLVGMYRVADNGGEEEPYPYAANEYTSDVELMWSDDGEDWYRTNNRQPIIPLHDSIKTIYTVGTLVGDSVYMYSCESTILHATYYSGRCGTGTYEAAAANGKYYSMYLYKMGVNKLNEWRPPTTVYVTAAVEGFINPSISKHVLKDTLKAELRSTTSPYSIESTIKALIDSSSLTGKFDFPHVSPGSYYLTIEGRNSLETWSASGISIVNSSSASYDFTTSTVKAYGGNLVLAGSKYSIYSGDINNDGTVDVVDVNSTSTDASNFESGYIDTDVDGNYFVDSQDVTIVYNNSSNFVTVINP